MKFYLAKKEPTAAVAVKATRGAPQTMFHELFQFLMDVDTNVANTTMVHRLARVSARCARQVASDELYELLRNWFACFVISDDA